MSPGAQGPKKGLTGKAVLTLQTLVIALEYLTARGSFPWHSSPWPSHFELSALPNYVTTCNAQQKPRTLA